MFVRRTAFFGDIYLAVNTERGKELAVKSESIKGRHPMLMYEAILIKHLQGVPGIPNVYYCATEGDYNADAGRLFSGKLAAARQTARVHSQWGRFRLH